MKHQANAYQRAVGQLMRERRLHHGLTLAKAAEGLPWTPNAIAFWERGDRAIRVEYLAQIARAYGCRTADLLPAEDGPWWRSW
jgi:transcriptional regulator with XRE-family HTH domain